ncbi:hypothetical protein [Kurthia sibirica]|uniref:Replication-associated protein RepC n=1 Tax=Kurthia sibirica TaxID=202750 RepID=A0A2U3AGZ4_9BACL|nr:hypothetical protein [Kurthia sibirica]PWI23731.1 hypothetical protein DEX24_15675 [Kurthia sibirica]GEK35571.1 hypothetical protein KSI01_31040 [Kurthia sibirica]
MSSLKRKNVEDRGPSVKPKTEAEPIVTVAKPKTKPRKVDYSVSSIRIKKYNRAKINALRKALAKESADELLDEVLDMYIKKKLTAEQKMKYEFLLELEEKD